MVTKSWIGLEGVCNNNGQKMIIIGGTKAKDITVQFEDGTIVEHKELGAFRKGQIKNPNCFIKSKKPWLGRKRQAVNGQWMTITGGTSGDDLEITFEDGTVVYHKDYSAFKRGQIKNPNFDTRIHRSQRHIGEEYMSVSGQKMVIVAWNGTKDMSVKFDDGTIVDHVDYSMVKRGSVENPNYTYRDRDLELKRKKLVGLSKVMSSGLKLTITDYYGNSMCKGVFEDGEEKEFRLDAFTRGQIGHPSGMTATKLRNKAEREGSSFSTVQGLKGIILEYNGTEDIKVKLSSGIETTTKWTSILKGRVFDHEYGKLIAHRKGKKFTYKDSIICEYMTTSFGEDYYACKCLKCELDEVLSRKELEKHISEETLKKVL